MYLRVASALVTGDGMLRARDIDCAPSFKPTTTPTTALTPHNVQHPKRHANAQHPKPPRQRPTLKTATPTPQVRMYAYKRAPRILFSTLVRSMTQSPSQNETSLHPQNHVSESSAGSRVVSDTIDYKRPAMIIISVCTTVNRTQSAQA